MKAIKLKEVLCIIATVVFIWYLAGENKVSGKSAEEMLGALSAASDFSALSQCDEVLFKERCGFDASEFEGAFYYASDSVMEVRELIVIKLGDFGKKEELKAFVEKKNEEKSKLFEGYAPEQSALLKSFVLEEKEGFFIFSVCSDPAAVRAAFKSTL